MYFSHNTVRHGASNHRQHDIFCKSFFKLTTVKSWYGKRFPVTMSQCFISVKTIIYCKVTGDGIIIYILQIRILHWFESCAFKPAISVYIVQYQIFHGQMDFVSRRCPIYTYIISKTLWAMETIWRFRSVSKSVQVMTCCLLPLCRHYLNQCWFISKRLRWFSPEINFASTHKRTVKPLL